VSRLHSLTPTQWLLYLAMALVYGSAGAATIHPAKVCPLGAISCQQPRFDYSLCRPNALLKFYVPGLSKNRNQRQQSATNAYARQIFSANRKTYTLLGDVRLQRADQLLRAQRIDYTQASTAYQATGKVRYQDQGLLLQAHSIDGTNKPEHAVAHTVRYQLLQARGNGTATRVNILDSKHSRYTTATFSTCAPQNRMWDIEAGTIHINQDTGIGTARNVTMRVHNVPFLWFPWMRFPIYGQRLSGFLSPSFGGSSQSGSYISVPYYLNLAPNYDATLTPSIYSRRGLLLGTEFRYLLDSSKGQFNFDVMPTDRLSKRQRWYLRFADHTALGSNWSFDSHLSRVSDPRYFEDFGNSLNFSAISLIGSNAYLRGSGRWWNATVGADTYQLTDPTLSPNSKPYTRLPRATFSAALPIGQTMQIGLNSEAVAFRKSHALNGRRVDLYPYFAMPMQGAAWFLRPQIGYRFTRYWLDRSSDAHPDRALPIVQLDSGLVFDRQIKLFGQSYTQTLEPRAYYLYVPYRNQNNLPIFDTQPLTFDYWTLFSSNQYTGADRQINANNLTLTLTSRLIDTSGVARLSASIGQIRYFTAQRVQLPRRTIVDQAGSNYVGILNLTLSPGWRLTLAQQYDPLTHRTTVSSVNLQARIGSDGVLNMAYRYRHRLLDQYDISTYWPVRPGWGLVGRWNYSVRDQKTLEAFAGLQWDNCCMAIRAVMRHYVRDFQGHTTNAIMFEVEFKGIGSIGQKSGTFLERAILGYP